MRFRALVPSMAAVAMLAPSTVQAFEIEGKDWTFNIKPHLQTRVEFAGAKNANGDDYDIWSGNAAGDEVADPQAFNMYARRVRLHTSGSNQDGFFFGLSFYADNLGRTSAIDGNSRITIPIAYAGKRFESGDMKHSIRFGLQQPCIAGPIALCDSSTVMLFNNSRLSAARHNDGFVLTYTLDHPQFSLAAAAGEARTKRSQKDDNSDIYFATRISSGFDPDMTLTARRESYLGKESNGLKHQAGLSFVYSDDVGDESYMTIGADYRLHYDAITALSEFYYTTYDKADGDAMSFMIQGGYAIPLDDGKVIEPALRFTWLDMDTDDSNEQGVLHREGGQSGIYIDAGVNYYIAGHGNKIQLNLQYYIPEDGDGDAWVIRLGHNLSF